jgi:hypothetical protein
MVSGDSRPATQPDSIGAGLAQLLLTQDPPIGSKVEVHVEQPVGELDGTLTSINDRWAVVDTGKENLGVWWIPVAKIKVIRVPQK